MSLEDIDPQFRLDAEVAPTFVVKNYDIDTGEFQVFYNDGTLNNDEWYGPLFMDLDSMRPDHEEPIRFQIAQYVYMMGVEQSIDMVALMKHRQNQAIKDETHVDPVLSAAQIVNIFSEDDFDEQFEALSAELAED